MFKHRLFSVFICFLMAFSLVQPTFAKSKTSSKQVVFKAVTGLGTTSKAARLDAFRNAIAQAVGVYVRADTLVENYILKSDRVRTNSQGFIKQFKLLKEVQSEGIFQATYSITVVTELMAHDFKKVMGSEFRNVGHPSVAVMGWHIGDTQISPEINQVAISAMNQSLIKKGYKVVDAYQVRLLRQKEALKAPTTKSEMEQIAKSLANRLKADIYVTTYITQKAGTLSLLTRMYNSYTGQIFGEETAYAAVGANPLKAAQSATKKTMGVILKDIYGHWQDVLTQGAEYIVILDGYTQGKERIAFKNILKKAPGVTQVKQLNVGGGKAEFSVYSSSAPQDLFDAILLQTLSQGFPIKNQEALIRGGRALFLL